MILDFPINQTDSYTEGFRTGGLLTFLLDKCFLLVEDADGSYGAYDIECGVVGFWNESYKEVLIELEQVYDKLLDYNEPENIYLEVRDDY